MSVLGYSHRVLGGDFGRMGVITWQKLTLFCACIVEFGEVCISIASMTVP